MVFPIGAAIVAGNIIRTQLEEDEKEEKRRKKEEKIAKEKEEARRAALTPEERKEEDEKAEFLRTCKYQNLSRLPTEDFLVKKYLEGIATILPTGQLDTREHDSYMLKSYGKVSKTDRITQKAIDAALKIKEIDLKNEQAKGDADREWAIKKAQKDIEKLKLLQKHVDDSLPLFRPKEHASSLDSRIDDYLKGENTILPNGDLEYKKHKYSQYNTKITTQQVERNIETAKKGLTLIEPPNFLEKMMLFKDKLEKKSFALSALATLTVAYPLVMKAVKEKLKHDYGATTGHDGLSKTGIKYDDRMYELRKREKFKDAVETKLPALLKEMKTASGGPELLPAQRDEHVYIQDFNEKLKGPDVTNGDLCDFYSKAGKIFDSSETKYYATFEKALKSEKNNFVSLHRAFDGIGSLLKKSERDSAVKFDLLAKGLKAPENDHDTLYKASTALTKAITQYSTPDFTDKSLAFVKEISSDSRLDDSHRSLIYQNLGKVIDVRPNSGLSVLKVIEASLKQKNNYYGFGEADKVVKKIQEKTTDSKEKALCNKLNKTCTDKRAEAYSAYLLASERRSR